jgi:NADH-quinone oxidoreductase subunit J
VSTANETFFLVCTLFAIGGAVGTVMAKSPLRAVIGLLINISALAGVFLSLQAQLLAVLQLIVYAGAVVVLFVFVIMLIGPSSTVQYEARGLLARTLGLSVMGLVGFGIAFALVGTEATFPTVTPQFGSVEAVGQALYRDSLVPFELVSITLLVAIVGAVAVARGRNAEEMEQHQKETMARDAALQKKREQEERLSAEVAAHERAAE